MIKSIKETRSIFTTSSLNFVYRIFGLGMSFIITVLISRLFGVAVFGNYSLVLAISQISALFFTLGIPSTLIKIVGNQKLTYHQSKDLLKKGLKGAVAISVIPATLVYFNADFIAVKLFKNAELERFLEIAAFSIPVFVANEIFLYFFLAIKNFKKFNFFMFVLPNIFLTTLLLLFATLHFSSESTLLSFAIAIFLNVILQAFTIFDCVKREERTGLSTRELIKEATPLLFSSLFMYMLNYTNTILLGLLVTENLVGVYNIAYKVGSVGLLIVISVSTIITPRIAELYGLKEYFALRKLIQNSTRLVAICTVPVVLILIFGSEFILQIWGEEAKDGSCALIIISVGIMFNALSGNVDQILNMTDNQRILQNITLVSFFFNLIFALLLIPQYGIVGAATASLVTNVVMNGSCMYYIKKKLGYYTLF
ncbi:flippase [Flavobacterium aurantiibacter]|uniref:Uncharacterized protein n=1 Tax=Flavobacterium aurantiibacter TaxID=2023067 RepID=A0A255ZJ66_9FLAO|nr:flippase [Flavobacterium aurantiibacter]OYQ41558.1 hypothetical protein CHX27_12870 [Flavobacterium aurantiibacter]